MERDQLSHDLASLKIDRSAPPAQRPWPRLVAKALIFSGVMGLIGGLFPAIRAARVSPIEAMRG